MSAMTHSSYLLGKSPRTSFVWRYTGRNQYEMLCGSLVRGTLALSLEPSILFQPNHTDFYRAYAQTGDRTYSFKCVFLDGTYRGNVMVDEGTSQPLALFEERASHFFWCRRRRIVLCESGTVWPWTRGADKGHWIARGSASKILELQSANPESGGAVRIYSPSALKGPHNRALILFCIYLAMGPKRLR